MNTTPDTRHCETCDATITIAALSYCWQCRAPLPTHTAPPSTPPLRSILEYATVTLAILIAITASLWWALQ